MIRELSHPRCGKLTAMRRASRIAGKRESEPLPRRGGCVVVAARRASFHPVVVLLLAASSRCFCADADPAVARVRGIILHSRQMGAHGMGYGERSLEELSRKIKLADIPVLLSLASDREVGVGTQFALASQCEAAIPAVREATVARKLDFLYASDALQLVSAYKRCTPAAQNRAREAGAELDALRREDHAKTMERAKREKEEDARIQRNAVTMMQGREQARTLSRKEREEVYRRSLKAMGLSEGGPMTSEQKELADRMYRSMVLGEPGASSGTQPK